MDSKKIILELTKAEADELYKLIDIAVKSAGLQVAHNAVVFHQKLNLAHKASIEPTEPKG